MGRTLVRCGYRATGGGGTPGSRPGGVSPSAAAAPSLTWLPATCVDATRRWSVERRGALPATALHPATLSLVARKSSPACSSRQRTCVSQGSNGVAGKPSKKAVRPNDPNEVGWWRTRQTQALPMSCHLARAT